MEFSGWDAAAALAKAIVYAGTLGAAGAIFFLTYSERLLRPVQRRGILVDILVLSLLAILASVARISLLTASMGDGATAMFDFSTAGMIMSAGEGWAIVLRIAGLALCAAALKPGRLCNSAACIGAMLAATSFAAVGHVHTLRPDRLPTAILILHLTCAAFWLGALWPLLKVAGGGDNALTATLVARFGKVATYVVGLLIGAGIPLAYLLLGSLAAVWNSDYGRMLAVKLLLVATLLSAAAINKLSLTPRLAAGDVRAAASLRHSIRFEMIVGGLILMITAAFTSFTGPAI